MAERRRADPTRMAAMANDPRAVSYRRGADGAPEHRCGRCSQWLPPTAEHFNVTSTGRLESYCRPCRRAVPSAPPAPAPHSVDTPATTGHPHLPDVLGGFRICRYCRAELPLTTACWPALAGGGFAAICLDCTDTLRTRANARQQRGPAFLEARHEHA